MGGIFKKIPAPLVVLLLTIPLGIYFNFDSILDASGKPFALVSIVDFWKDVKFTASFAASWKWHILVLCIHVLVCE